MMSQVQSLERKATTALQQMEGESEHQAAVRLQTMVRMKQARVQRYERERIKEFNKLKSEASTVISEVRRVRPYSLFYGGSDDSFGLADDDDVMLAAGEILGKLDSVRTELKLMADKTLLLKPESIFSVRWKRLVMLAVVFELFLAAMAPLLLKSTQTESLEDCFESMLMPEFCSPKEAPNSGFWTAHVGFASGRDNKLADECDQKRLARRVIATYMAQFIKSHIWFVGTIAFLNTFVVFFEGRRDANGVLVPKPFFQRWIFPGILFQIAMNPAMANVSALVKHWLFYLYIAGPARVFRWILALSPWFGYGRVSLFYTLDTLVAHAAGPPRQSRAKESTRLKK
jgi:hypothetical protein